MTRKLPPDPVMGQRILDVMRTFISELERAIRARVATVPPVPAPPAARVAVLFSGGLDCTVVAAVLDRVLPRHEAIDLITVAFENPRSLKAREETLQRPPKGPSHRGIRGPRRKTETPAPPPNGIPLLNDESSEDAAQPLGPYDVPDRLTARDAWRDLRELAPNRQWNLVEVDVPYQEMLDHRQHVIDLMKPQNTVMDLSIALAFYFAARGQGHLAAASDEELEAELYTSHARVLLSGLGADELLGGYARHRRAFNQPVGRHEDNVETEQPPSSVFPGQAPGPPAHENWQALIDELQMDLDRLPTRNLGRDDRIIATHGKEARYPFLAGHVVEFLARQPVWYKADMRFVEGVGDKMLLRSVARELGLHKAARRKKRAIHFGARTAKMDLGDGGAKGTDLL
jgi:asparagine synthetase B (glutamine-hydrolysing)